MNNKKQVKKMTYNDDDDNNNNNNKYKTMEIYIRSPPSMPLVKGRHFFRYLDLF